MKKIRPVIISILILIAFAFWLGVFGINEEAGSTEIISVSPWKFKLTVYITNEARMLNEIPMHIFGGLFLFFSLLRIIGFNNTDNFVGKWGQIIFTLALIGMAIIIICPF